MKRSTGRPWARLVLLALCGTAPLTGAAGDRASGMLSWLNDVDTLQPIAAKHLSIVAQNAEWAEPSPDGAEVASLRVEGGLWQVRLFSLGSKMNRIVHQQPYGDDAARIGHPLVWDPDGEHLYIQVYYDGFSHAIWVPFDTRKMCFLADDKEELDAFLRTAPKDWPDWQKKNLPEDLLPPVWTAGGRKFQNSCEANRNGYSEGGLFQSAGYLRTQEDVCATIPISPEEQGSLFLKGGHRSGEFVGFLFDGEDQYVGKVSAASLWHMGGLFQYQADRLVWKTVMRVEQGAEEPAAPGGAFRYERLTFDLGQYQLVSVREIRDKGLLLYAKRAKDTVCLFLDVIGLRREERAVRSGKPAPQKELK